VRIWLINIGDLALVAVTLTAQPKRTQLVAGAGMTFVVGVLKDVKWTFSNTKTHGIDFII